MRKTRWFPVLILAATALPCLANDSGKAAGEGVMSGDIEQTAASGRFKPTHSYAWKESRGAKQNTLIYLFDRDVPADQWADAEDRKSAISGWMLANKATVVSWTIDEDGKADSVQSCGSDGSCRASGNSVMNGVASLVADIKDDGKGGLSGTLSQGSPGCGDQWCEVTSRYSIDTTLAPPTLRNRLASSGKTDSADAATVRTAVTAYWKAAGSAKRSDDLTPYFSAERITENQRQTARNGKMLESMFTQVFVPAHGGQLEITEVRTLDASALARVKTRVGSGDQAYDMQCGLLLRKEGGSWKIGAEDC